MRELKFRAWDNLEKRMRKVVSLHWQGDKLVSARLEGENVLAVVMDSMKNTRRK